MNRRPSLLWPSVLISAGALLLLENFRLLPPGLWAALAQLWPMLIIVLGLHMLIGRRAALGVSVLVLSGVLGWAAWSAQQLPEAGVAHFTGQTLGNAQSANVQVEFNVGVLSLSALGPSAHLMEGTVRHAAGDTLWQMYAVENGVGQLRLIQNYFALFVPFLPPTEANAQWAIQLSRSVPLTIGVQVEAGAAHLDLTDLQLTSVILETNGGDTTLLLPADAPLRLTINAGLDAVTMPARFIPNGNVFTTANFAPTRAFVEVTLTVKAGRVTIR